MSTIAITARGFSGAPLHAGARSGGPDARLTRRGRMVLSALALVLLVLGAVVMSGGAPAAAGPPRGAAVRAERVTVRPGETLWAIAEREAPGVDPRETVARILDLNALKSSAVVAGSVLLLPTR